MKRIPSLLFVVSLMMSALFMYAPAVYAQISILHQFAGGTEDGYYPESKLTLDGSVLYGTASMGGDNNFGTIYSINTDGSSYTLLHEFTGNGGRLPYGELVQVGTKLYSMTNSGGNNDAGTIYSINTDGSDFTTLHQFVGGANDGSYPFGSLLQSGSTLYGMTSVGGDDNLGTIFSINTDGSGFTLLHKFSGGAGDGREPYGSLTQSGSTLYGMSYLGGDHGRGTIFSINTDGSDFTTLHEFAGGADDGEAPYGNLIQAGSTLYGATS